MLPALGFQRLAALRSDERDGGAVGAERKDAADSGDGNAGDFAGKAGGGRGGEEEFVVFSAVEGLGEGCGWVDGQGGSIDFGGYAGFLAEAGEIGGEAVAEVEGGRGERVALKPEALIDARLGVEVGGELRFQFPGDARRVGAGGLGRCQFGQAGEGGGGTAKGSGDVEQVAGTRAGAEQGFSAGNPANEDDVGDGDGGLGQVAAGERGFVGCGEGEQAVEEALDPGRAAA